MKEALIPLDVPWMVSPSVPALNVCTWESDNTFVACNVTLPEGISPRGEPLDPSSPRVVLTFKAGQWVDFSPPYSGDSSVDLSRYDLSELPLAGVAPEGYLDALDRFWSREQKCPDPGVYEVQYSSWINRVGADRYGCRHYIVAGHDARVEVLATGWTWEYMVEERPYYNDAAALKTSTTSQ